MPTKPQLAFRLGHVQYSLRHFNVLVMSHTMQHVGGALIAVLKHAGIAITALGGGARGDLRQVGDGRLADVANVVALDPRPLDCTTPVPQGQLAPTLALQCHCLARLRHP